MLHALKENVLRQINANEYHFAARLLVLAPCRSQIAAHQLVYALEDDFALRALHVQNAFVAQHARPVNIDDGTQKVFQFGRIECALGAKNKALDIVIMVVMVTALVRRVIAMLAVFVIMRMAMVRMFIFLKEIRINIELGIEVEAL